jgi:short-subunit dehydrogenase
LEQAMARLALVTGASAGIGAAFARAYAKRGYDIAVTARRQDRLAALAASLSKDHRVEARSIPADLAQPGACAALLEQLGRPVDVLINNAGYGLGGGFMRPDWSQQAASLQVMLTAPTELAHRVIPPMKRAGFGRIVNVASLAGLAPPGQGLYGPIKAYLIRFSQALHAELASSGVHVTALCPGFTRSEFHAAAQMEAEVASVPAIFWQSAEAVVEAGIAANEANQPVVVTGWPNKAAAALTKLTPDSWAMQIIRRGRR